MQHAMFGDSDCSVESQNKSKTLRRCDPPRSHSLPERYCVVSLVWDDSLMDFEVLGTGQCPRNNKMHDPEEHIVTRNFGNRIAALKANTRTTLRRGNPLPNHVLTERFSSGPCLDDSLRFGVLGILRRKIPAENINTLQQHETLVSTTLPSSLTLDRLILAFNSASSCCSSSMFLSSWMTSARISPVGPSKAPLMSHSRLAPCALSANRRAASPSLAFTMTTNPRSMASFTSSFKELREALFADEEGDGEENLMDGYLNTEDEAESFAYSCCACRTRPVVTRTTLSWR